MGCQAAKTRAAQGGLWREGIPGKLHPALELLVTMQTGALLHMLGPTPRAPASRSCPRLSSGRLTQGSAFDRSR